MRLFENQFENWNILFSSKFNSSKTVDTSLEDENNLITEMTIPEYFISNVSVIKKFKSGNYIKFGIKNIFNYVDSNTEAPDFLASYEPERHFFISMNLKLSKGAK